MYLVIVIRFQITFKLDRAVMYAYLLASRHIFETISVACNDGAIRIGRLRLVHR